MKPSPHRLGKRAQLLVRGVLPEPARFGSSNTFTPSDHGCNSNKRHIQRDCRFAHVLSVVRQKMGREVFLFPIRNYFPFASSSVYKSFAPPMCLISVARGPPSRCTKTRPVFEGPHWRKDSP